MPRAGPHMPMNFKMLSRKQGFAARVTTLFLMLLVDVQPAQADRGVYGTELPVNLAEAEDLRALVPCADVFPGAACFSKRMEQPPYVGAYDVAQSDKAALLGYVMLSTDITDIPVYSGKPVTTLIGMDQQGRYVGIEALKHSGPVLLLGIPEPVLLNFDKQYIGKSIKGKIEVSQSRSDEGVPGVDMTLGATVTMITQNQVLATAISSVTRQVDILAPTRHEPTCYMQTGQRASWTELVEQGSVQHLLVHPEQPGPERAPESLIELWFGGLSHPGLGASLLGQSVWNDPHVRLERNEHAIFIIHTAGVTSFKGSGFVRGGIYDCTQIKQGTESFTLRNPDYPNPYGLAASNVPAYTKSATFVMCSPASSTAYPRRLSFLGNRVDRATGTHSFVTSDAPHWLPETLLRGGHPYIDESEALQQQVRYTRTPRIAFFIVLLVSVGVMHALRERPTRRSTYKNKWPVDAFRYTARALSISLVGSDMMAQPSITQVLTWFHSLLLRWTWSLFLTDPFIFYFWIFTILTVFLFGQGLFCGWLCPFNSLSEALYKIDGRPGLKHWQRHLPHAWYDRLKWLKYAIFSGLLTTSVFSMGLVEKLAEVEPFKTTFPVDINHRAQPCGLFVCTLLGISLFVGHPYCKYICPLSVALITLSTSRWFDLRRRQDCNSCGVCAAGCGSLVIDTDNRIDHRECLYYLDCMVLYTDVKGCPSLVKKRKRRERDGLEVTPIGKGGYFTPIQPVPVSMDPRVAQGPDPRMPADRVMPTGREGARDLRWLMLELHDHL